jgi:hypothetical protein
MNPTWRDLYDDLNRRVTGACQLDASLRGTFALVVDA